MDITRLTSRVGRGPYTGIDRVELAYLEWCLSTNPDLWGLAKLADGYALLDRAGLHAFHDRLTGVTPWGTRDLRAVIGLKTPAPRGAAESDLRRLAKHHVSAQGLPPHLSTLAQAGAIYLNVGHSNISGPLALAMKTPGMKVVIFLHDLIPLELPQMQRTGSVPAFTQKLEVIAEFADCVITNSKDSQTKITAELKSRDATPPVAFAHLGIDAPPTLPVRDTQNRPYYVTIGTIEPRKNQSLLLDIWQDLEAELPKQAMPELHIIGQRGWVGKDVITRLDRLKSNPWIHEHSSMTDDALWPLLANAQALLFPTLAEGFGLPSLEAAALGTSVICGDLAVHHELLGDYPVYVDLQDRYLWKKAMIEHLQTEPDSLRHACAQNMPQIPNWDAHFSSVNHAVTRLG